jgi:aspartate aminotransferase
MGEPYAGTPNLVVAAALEALKTGKTRYERLTGSVSLREALATHLTIPRVRAIRSEEVVVTHGASAGLAASILALINPGDRVIIPEPTYSLYADHVAMAGGEVVWVHNRADGLLDLVAIESALPGARMVIVCNPNNPTSQIVNSAEMIQLAQLVERYDNLLLVDEAYADIVFDDAEFYSSLSLHHISDRVVTCGTFSKSYAMTGWRIGWVVAGKPLADSINLVHRTINGAMNTFVQIAAEAALKITSSELAMQAKEYQLRRDIVMDRLRGLGPLTINQPQGAFYAFPRIAMPVASDDFVEKCAAGGVLVRSGREFGPSGEGHVRLSFATDLENLQRGLDRFVSVVESVC